jgi:hypothetical protein
LLFYSFDSVRNFTSMRLHANNMFFRDVRVFSRAIISAIADDDEKKGGGSPAARRHGRQGDPAVAAQHLDATASRLAPRKRAAVNYSYERDSISEAARTVAVPLNNLVGRTLRVQLDFDARWMMLSEAHFESSKNAALCGQFVCVPHSHCV